jgi:hypothetical protein
MILRWPKYEADKPIQSCCLVSLAYTGVVPLALFIVTAALVRSDYAGSRHGEAGISLLAVFTIAPMMVAGLPWSVMIMYDTHLPEMLQYVLVGAGVLVNALLIGFAIGVVRAVRGKTP